METSSGKPIKTGIFVIVTLLLFVVGLYNIGGKRRVFQSTLKLTAIFKNVNGLLPGNNVRFGGIDIGTVSKIDIISDTAVRAEFSIEPKSAPFITSTSIASIGTDGMMGNKIVNIGPGSTAGISLKEGEVVKTLPLVELDNAMRTLNKTNDNLEMITDDAKIVMNRFSSKNTLWSLLMDTAVADNVKQVIVSFKISSKNAVQFTNSLNQLAGRINDGKGSLGELIRDTSLAVNLNQAAADIRASGKKVLNITSDLNEMSYKLAHGEGSLGVLMNDTGLVYRVDQTLYDFRNGAANFDTSMVALKHNFLFRRYYRKMEKENQTNKVKWNK